MKQNIFGLFQEELAACLKPYGLPAFRAKQIVRWLYQRQAASFAEMTDLAKAQRELLAEHFTIDRPVLKAEQASGDGKTVKYLLQFADGAAIETVLMRQPYGNSVCVSTQVGCAMGCAFCASTLMGVTRNLLGGEILAQVLFAQAALAQEGQHVTSIVIMGSGEPLANYEEVLRFIRLCHTEYSLGLSYRSITLSTCGLVPNIDRLATEGLPLTLSISLHAPNQELRTRLMPVNATYPLSEVLAAGDRYAAKTGRRLTYEYTLIDGINDQPEHAAELAGLMKGRLANVNLIPVNAVPERGLHRPSPQAVQAFAAALEKRRVNVTVRREMGSDIKAACGQLRQKVLNAEGKKG